jgi:dTDP-4-amino-4,6-dideoxygalactose transaminase
MSDINAALAFSQFKKINKFISKRKIISKRYNKILKNLPNLYLTEERKIKNSSNHLFIIHIAFNKIKKKKDIFFEYLKKNNVLAQFHYTPLYEIDYLKKSIKNKFDKMTGSKLYKKNSISIPIYYDLNLKNQMRVINLIKNFIYD